MPIGGGLSGILCFVGLQGPSAKGGGITIVGGPMLVTALEIKSKHEKKWKERECYVRRESTRFRRSKLW
jgi:hypothetical protein